MFIVLEWLLVLHDYVIIVGIVIMIIIVNDMNCTTIIQYSRWIELATVGNETPDKNESKTKENNYKLFQLQFSFHLAVAKTKEQPLAAFGAESGKFKLEADESNWRGRRQTQIAQHFHRVSVCSSIIHSFSQSTINEKRKQRAKASESHETAN